MEWFLGSGPDRGRSPVEWGDFLFVHPFVRPSPPAWLALRPDWLALGPSRGRTDGKSPHSKGLCPLSGPLPKNDLFHRYGKW